MRSLEEIDPVLLDQAICRLLIQVQNRPLDREAAISSRLSQSAELREWIQILCLKSSIAASKLNLTLSQAQIMQLYTAFALGLEVGYVLYEHELERS